MLTGWALHIQLYKFGLPSVFLLQMESIFLHNERQQIGILLYKQLCD
jgi:hypothetical protein